MDFCLVSITSCWNDVLLQNRLDRNCPQDSEALQSSDSRGTWMTVCLRYSTTVAQERACNTEQSEIIWLNSNEKQTQDYLYTLTKYCEAECLFYFCKSNWR